MKELLYLFIENKLNLLFVYLPESLKTGLAVILYSVFVLLLLYYMQKYTQLFFRLSKKNRKIMLLDQVSNKGVLKNEQINGIYSREEEILHIKCMTKCRNRRLALFFYNLTRITKNKISPSHFKKLYSHLILEKDDIKLSESTILVDNIAYFIFATLFFGLTSEFLYFFWISPPNYGRLIFILFILIFSIITFYFLSLIIRKKEKEEFIEIKNSYLKRLSSVFKI